MQPTARNIADLAVGPDHAHDYARALAALQLSCGIDLRVAVSANRIERAGIGAKISRALERERLRGLRRHWSYDLNRHIALKQALILVSDGV